MNASVAGFALMCAGLLSRAASSAAHSAQLCPSTKTNLDWSSQCFEVADAGRRVKPRYVKNIVTDRTGHATIVIASPRELLAVDRRGVVKVSNIYHTGDFDYPDAEGGVGRFAVAVKSATGETSYKCGYFDGKTFAILIPAIYDNCHAFKDGEAVVCNDCVRYCTEFECQNSVFVGGQGFAINRRNKILAAFAQKTLDGMCASPELLRVEKINRTTPYLQCLPVAGSPFNTLR